MVIEWWLYWIQELLVGVEVMKCNVGGDHLYDLQTHHSFFFGFRIPFLSDPS